MSDNSIFFLIPLILSIAFLSAALVLLVIVPLRMRKNTAVCTVPVNAQIVDMNKTYFGFQNGHNSAPSYAPVYEFTFSGTVHSIASNLYSTRIPNIGEVRTLMIDPENVSRFYDPSTRGRTKMITTVVGIAMLFFGILSAVITLFLFLSGQFV